MSLADTFNSDAFSLISLTTAINELEYQPGRIGEMGIFQEKGIAHTTAVVESKGGVLELLPTQERGGEPTLGKTAKRTVRSFKVPHIPHDDKLLADDIQGVRKFGSEDQEEVLAEKVNEKLADMRQRHEVTKEHMMAGALQGIVLDADGSTLLNLFTEFSVTEETNNYALGSNTTLKADVRRDVRHIESVLGARQKSVQIRAICGPTWWDAFIAHAEVEAAYDRWRDGEFLREDHRDGFTWQGVTWEEYVGTVSGQAFFPANEMHMFPINVPNLYTINYAPADFVETVNTIGLPMYAKQAVMKFDKGVDIHTQSNPLVLCTRPGVLVQGTNT